MADPAVVLSNRGTVLPVIRFPVALGRGRNIVLGMVVVTSGHIDWGMVMASSFILSCSVVWVYSIVVLVTLQSLYIASRWLQLFPRSLVA